MSFKHILLLLKIKFLILLNSFIKGSFKKNIRKFFALAGGSVLFFVIYLWILEILSVLSTNGSAGTLLLENFLLVVFFAFFIFLLASGITLSIHYLFISNDLPFLLSSPITDKSIFAFKLFETTIANSNFFLFIGIPVYIAFGVVAQAGWYYYPIILLNAFCFLAIPVSVSFLGALLIVRIIPATRARERMAILLAIVSFGIWLSLQIFRASQFDRSSTDFSPQTFEKLKQLSHFSFISFLPSTWAARSLTGLAKGDFILFSVNFLFLLLLTFCLFYLSIKLSRNAFEKGFVSSQQSITIFRSKKVSKQAGLNLIPLLGLRFSIVFSILIRDLKLIIRDSRQMTTHIMFAAMMIIFPLLNKHDNGFSKFAIYQPYIFVILFGGLLAAQMSSRLIPLEAKSFWITKLAPQSAQRIILGKFLLGFLLSTLMCWLAVVFVSFYYGHPLRILILALVATLGFSAMLSSTGLFLGAKFAQFDWEHPKRMLTTSGSLLLSLTLFLSVGIIGGIVAAIYLGGNALQLSMEFMDIFAVSIGLTVVFLIVNLMNFLSANRLDHMEWVL